VGRYNTVDPVFSLICPNLGGALAYVYVHHNPITKVDFQGLHDLGDGWQVAALYSGSAEALFFVRCECCISYKPAGDWFAYVWMEMPDSSNLQGKDAPHCCSESKEEPDPAYSLDCCIYACKDLGMKKKMRKEYRKGNSQERTKCLLYAGFY
jgi:hypothetical protein